MFFFLLSLGGGDVVYLASLFRSLGEVLRSIEGVPSFGFRGGVVGPGVSSCFLGFFGFGGVPPRAVAFVGLQPRAPPLP